MTEENIQYRDRMTKRKRRLKSVATQENIKQRLSGDPVAHVVYEGNEDEDLQELRNKLKPNEGCNLQIRNNKIYEVRKRLSKNDVIIKTMKQTIEILRDKDLLQTDSTVDNIYKSVMNSFLGGSVKAKYKIKNKDI